MSAPEKVIIGDATIYVGDCLASLRTMLDQSVHCCITSPPYFGLRDYGHDGQIGLEQTPDEYVARLVEVFREVRRVLRDDGTLWLNLGDSYARNPAKGGSGPAGKNRDWYGDNYGDARGADVPNGLKEKDLIGIPWRVAFALQADGWYLRQDIIWHKPNPMPESVRDRCTKAHEYLFLLAKSERYYFDGAAISEPIAPASIQRLSQTNLPNQAGSTRVPGKTNGPMKAVGPRFCGYKYSDGKRNKRSVWTIATKPFKEAHFATFPPELVEPCVLAGCPAATSVLDPFGGSGTTSVVATQHGRSSILCELNPDYVEMARRRIEDAQRQQRLVP